MEAKIVISNFLSIEQDVKKKAIDYLRAAKAAEQSVQKYEDAKFAPDSSISHKNYYYEQMLTHLKASKEKETFYKETIDNANSQVKVFRDSIEGFVKGIMTMEKDRVEAVHSAVNKFVVYEKFSEMNNKYDVNNFSKTLEEFSEQAEMEELQATLGEFRCPSFEFISYESKNFSISKLNQDQLSPPKEREEDPQ